MGVFHASVTPNYAQYEFIVSLWQILVPMLSVEKCALSPPDDVSGGGGRGGGGVNYRFRKSALDFLLVIHYNYEYSAYVQSNSASSDVFLLAKILLLEQFWGI